MYNSANMYTSVCSLYNCPTPEWHKWEKKEKYSISLTNIFIRYWAYIVNAISVGELAPFITMGPLYKYGLTLILTWISDYTHYEL